MIGDLEGETLVGSYNRHLDLARVYGQMLARNYLWCYLYGVHGFEPGFEVTQYLKKNESWVDL